MDATAKFVAIIAVAAFATERILAAVKYLMNAVRLYRARSGIARRLRAREWRKLFLAVIAAVIAYVVVDRAHLRLLGILQVGNVHPLFDFWLTWLVVVAGADRVHSMIGGGGKGGGASSDRKDPPVVRVKVDGEPHRAS